MAIRFILDGEAIEIADAPGTATLLDHLRYTMRRTGTKEGCAEGDCGACTVLVGEAQGGGVAWRAVNACIQFLPMLHGNALMTVESLGGNTALQACMAANGSSQCGFCTPGFVMSLHGRSLGAAGCDLPVEDVIAGNLCRCTGYGPIMAAGRETVAIARDDAALAAQLAAIPAGASGDGWHAPASVEALAALLAANPDARIVAGATDVALWVTKELRDLGPVIFVGDIPELRRIEETAEGLTIGAAVRYAEAHAALARLHPDLGELVRRLGGLQVRNAATVGGNIATGSPSGDGPPALIALDAQLTLASAAGRRTMPLADYFLDYGRQDRRAGEFVESVFVPRPRSGDLIHIAKLSRRFDSDISAVCGALRLRIVDGTIAEARVAFGGMAGTPRRAPGCEAALTGQAFDEATVERAVAALAGDYTPLDDVRGSAAYRGQAAASLLWRMWHREAGRQVSVRDVEAVDA